MKPFMLFLWSIITVISGILLISTFSSGDASGMRATLVVFVIGGCTIKALTSKES